MFWMSRNKSEFFAKNCGNMVTPHGERENFRKVSHFLWVVFNENGCRFVDKGSYFRNHIYMRNLGRKY